MIMNLYRVTDANHEWCCFVFETSRYRAKVRVANYFDEHYLSLRCKTLEKKVAICCPMLVDDEEAEGYDIVLSYGYRYASIEE